MSSHSINSKTWENLLLAETQHNDYDRRKQPENGVSDRLRSFTIRRNTAASD
jgi:hypothetical protein